MICLLEEFSSLDVPDRRFDVFISIQYFDQIRSPWGSRRTDLVVAGQPARRRLSVCVFGGFWFQSQFLYHSANFVLREARLSS